MHFVLFLVLLWELTNLFSFHFIESWNYPLVIIIYSAFSHFSHSRVLMRFFGNSRISDISLFLFLMQHFIDFNANKLISLNIMIHYIIFFFFHHSLLIVHEIIADQFVNFIFGSLNIIFYFFCIFVSLLINCLLFFIFEVFENIS